MSYEGGVTPSDMMQDIMPKVGNPPQADCGQRGSRHMAVVGGYHLRAQYLAKVVNEILTMSQTANLQYQGCM